MSLSYRLATTMTAVLATATATSALLLAGPASAAGELVLPARYDAGSVALGQLAASRDAVVYARNEGGSAAESLVAVVGSGAPRTLPVQVRDLRSLVGRQVASLVQVPGGTGTRAELLDLTTMTTTYGGSYTNSSPCTCAPYFVSGSGDGWIDVQQADDPATGEHQLLVRHDATGAHVLVPVPPHSWVTGATADADGFLLRFLDSQQGVTTYDLVDGGTSTVLYSGRSAPPVAVSHSQVAVGDDDGVLRVVPRADPTSAGVRRVPTTGQIISDVAVTDTATAWVQARIVDGAGNRAYRTWSAVGSGPGTAVRAAPRVDTEQLAAAGDRFIVVGGATPRTRGVYGLRPGSDQMGVRVAAAGPAAPGSIGLSAGRLLVSEAGLSESGQTPLAEQGLVRSGADVALRGSERVLGSTEPRFDGQGGRTADLEHGPDGQRAVVRDGTSVVARLPADGATGVAVSGQRVAVASFTYTTAGATPSTAVYDLGTPGATPRVLDGVFATALAGRRLAYLGTDGAVLSLDLDVPGAPAVVVRPADAARAASSPIVRASGDWVAWSFPAWQGLTAEVGAARTGVPASRRTLGVDAAEVELADGVLGWVDRDDLQAHLLPLGGGAGTVLGVVRPEGPGQQHLAMTDGLAAYVATDGSTHVVPVVGSDRPVTLLGGTVSRRVGPGGQFRLALDATRPVSSFTLALACGGRTVRTLTGSAPDGGLRTGWDGTADDGSAVPTGDCTWRLSGTGPGGGTLRGDGPGAPLRGSFVLER